MRKVFSLLFVVTLTLASASASYARNGADVYHVDLHALNDSGVSGKAQLILKGDELRVHIVARGLEPDALHPQHIHGLPGNKNAVCPPPSADQDGDGLIELLEGLPFYGPVLLPLQPFPTADHKGKITFKETYTINNPDLLNLEDEVIVLHGMTVDGQYIVTLPVACGQIMQVSGGHR